MKRSKTAKGKQQRKHAIQRFSERFRIKFTQEIRDEFIHQIRYGRAIFLERDSNRVSTWIVFNKDKPFVIVYDKERKNIVTVLPKKNEFSDKINQLVEKQKTAKKQKEESKKNKHVRYNIDLEQAEKDIKYYEINGKWEGGDVPDWAIAVANYYYYNKRIATINVKLIVKNWIKHESPEKTLEKIE